MSFPPKIREDAFVACGRHCCLCHRFCGLKIEIHHIIEKFEGGGDSYDNAIPLCFDCHSDMRTYDNKHPKGSKYTQDELRRHRDIWYEKIQSTPIRAYGDIGRNADRELFARITETLPYQPTMYFIETFSFGGSFYKATLDPIYEFYAYRNDPNMEFLDSDVESLRKNLIKTITILIEKIGVYSFSDRSSPGYIGIPIEWKARDHDKFLNATDEINAAANAAMTSYRDLIRECRFRLSK